MILDVALIIIFVISVISGRKAGLFLTVARLGSLLLASICTALFGKQILSFFQSCSLYDFLAEKVEGVIENTVKAGETALFAPFLEEADMVTGVAAGGITDMFFTALIFVLFSVLVRILIRVINKFVCRLPLVGQVNRFLGMAVSFVFTGIVAYLVIGIFGGIIMCSDAMFLQEQMASSFLVRAMYENNIILKLFN